MASTGGAWYAAVPHFEQMGYLASGLLCLGGIVGLADQKSARLGNMLGMMGVANGMFTTLLYLNQPGPLLFQTLGTIGVMGAIGTRMGQKVAVTELPQTVAMFHSLVGQAAVMTSLASFMGTTSPDMLHAIASYFGTFIGGVTFTGSIVAYLKLAAIMKKG